MLDFYNPNDIGTHIIRCTFMAWGYVGHISREVGGNCKGADLLMDDFLGCDSQEDIDCYAENDCEFSFDEETKEYTAVLKREDGDTLEYSGDGEEFKRIMVGIEFTSFIPE